MYIDDRVCVQGKYEPGKRHWLKVKKDYLCGGAMADSADLVVLGAWYGTGNTGLYHPRYIDPLGSTQKDLSRLSGRVKHEISTLILINRDHRRR